MLSVIEMHSTFNMYDSTTLSDDCGESRSSVQEVYCSARLYKCYAISQPPYKMFILFSAKIQTYAMSSVSKKLLQSLIKERYI
ncbi:hypothetical protein EB796_010524 [Bugula neritina]|uniref:FUZ/MON1/HPS1 third Longin domain-containing protein n=1 Tax=Bugula neritina TaxID=10212 RepID=A0A7J7K0Q3_BUGNE|nr:hypothetical protein EB796_010524 [Bugula neritina]